MTKTNLIYKIYELIETEEGNQDKFSEKIINKYKKTTTSNKAIIDDIFIDLCGYSLETLINGEED